MSEPVVVVADYYCVQAQAVAHVKNQLKNYKLVKNKKGKKQQVPLDFINTFDQFEHEYHTGNALAPEPAPVGVVHAQFVVSSCRVMSVLPALFCSICL